MDLNGSELLAGIVFAIAIIVLMVRLGALETRVRSLRATIGARVLTPLPSQAAPIQATVDILQADIGGWRYHSSRPVGHPDIAEALVTPGMAIRRDGVIEEGKQNA